MWHKMRWIFPVIFAGIIVFKIYGHFTVPPRQVLPRGLPDRYTGAPRAGQVGETVLEPVDDADEPEETTETVEPARSKLPVIALVSAVGLTAGYFGVRKIMRQAL